MDAPETREWGFAQDSEDEEQSQAAARSPEQPHPLQGRDEPKSIGMPARALLLLEVFQMHSAKPFPPRSSAPRAGSDAHNYGALWDAESGHSHKELVQVVLLPSSHPTPDFGG